MMKSEAMPTPPPNGELEVLLEYLHERRNFDFRRYKRASLTRRIFKRMQMIHVDDYRRYMEILEANPGEFSELFNTILINVTSLLRDKDAWQSLTTQVIPAIVEGKASEEPIRIWVRLFWGDAV
jgi:two-component system, chemotaxis family, CheB/CheR fusion protein